MIFFWIWVLIISYFVIGFFVAKFHVSHWEFDMWDAENVFWLAWIFWPFFLLWQIGYQIYNAFSKAAGGGNPFHAFAKKYIKE
jgi:hypothetical protein